MEHESMRERNNKRLGWASALMGLIFGSLITFVGVAVFKDDNFGIKRLQQLTSDRDDVLMKLFGGLCILYGVWRLYRSFDKFKNG
jgi:hypothetical protein